MSDIPPPSDTSLDFAMMVMAANSELGQVIGFLQRSFACQDEDALARELFSVLKEFGLQGQLRLGQQLWLDQQGQPLNEADHPALQYQAERISDQGAHTLVHFPQVSLLVTNMPVEDPLRHGRLKDNLVVLLEGANARLQSLLAARQADMAKTEFLANMSHELRTPMHAILNFASMGEKRAHQAPVEKLGHYFLRIHESGQRLLHLLNNLLDLAKLEAGRVLFTPSAVEMRALLEHCLQELEPLLNDKQLQVSIETEGQLQPLQVDAHQMAQVWINLLANAARFSPAQGKILIRLQQQESQLLASIEDQGIGIPEDELESVFDKFAQSRHSRTGAGGTGLGLAICRQIIRLHQGRIWAEPCQQGARLCFSLPR